MKKYLINITNLGLSFYLELPKLNIKKEQKSGVLANVINWLYQNSFPLIIIFLVSYPIVAINSELIAFNTLITAVGLMMLFFFGRAILLGKNLLRDPAFFLQALIFALLSISSTVLAIPANPSNTFGIGEFRILSGIAILLSVALFYFTRMYIDNDFKVKNTLRSLYIGGLLYFIFLSLTTISIELRSEIYFFVFISTFTLLYALNSSRLKLVKTLATLLLILLSLGKLSGLQSFTPAFADSLVPLILTAAILVSIVYVSRRDNLKYWLMTTYSHILDLFKGKSKTPLREILKSIWFSLLILSPLILLVLLIILIIRGNYSFLSIRSDFQSIVNSVSYLFEFAKKNFFGLFTGKGVSAYISTYPLLANIIRIQGLFGLLAYSLTSFFAIWQMVKLFKSNKYSIRFLCLVGFVIIFIPVLALTGNVSLLLSAFWWITFAILSYISVKDNFEFSFKNVRPITIRGKLNNRIGIVLRLIILILVSVFIIYSMLAFLNIIYLY